MGRISQRDVTQVRVVLNAHDCPTCGVVYGLTEELERRRRDDGGGFYCPNGHTIVFAGGERERLREQVSRLQTQKDHLLQSNERLCNDLMDAAKEARRLQRRAAAGMCEVCRRTFANKANHMKKKHPDFGQGKGKA